MTVGIAGLGLIGGSLAKALKSRTAHRVLGLDADRAVTEKALGADAIDGVIENTGECDFIIIALYPKDVRAFFKERLREFKPSAVIVDCAGVKRNICRELSEESGGRFVGGHPMAGIERSGFDNSFPELFEGASMILCKDEYTSDAAIEAAGELFMSLGFGKVTVTTAEEHDRMIAFTSQLAHVVSNAYVKSESAKKQYGFSANSFKDLTRVARLDENMWTELFFENGDNLVFELESIRDRLQEYISALKTGDYSEMRRLLRDGVTAKERSELIDGRKD